MQRYNLPSQNKKYTYINMILIAEVYCFRVSRRTQKLIGCIIILSRTVDNNNQNVAMKIIIHTRNEIPISMKGEINIVESSYAFSQSGT